MKKNNKGFTLIELLAVIVVLAILILLAMPKVTSMMEKARKNSFAVEASEIVKVAQTAYSDSILSGDDNVKSCFTVDQLISGGFLDKKKDEITGYVEFKQSDSTDAYIVIAEFNSNGYNISDKEENFDKNKNGKFTGEDAEKGTKTITTPGACKTTTE